MSMLEDRQDCLLTSLRTIGIFEPLRFGWQGGFEGSQFLIRRHSLRIAVFAVRSGTDSPRDARL